MTHYAVDDTPVYDSQEAATVVYDIMGLFMEGGVIFHDSASFRTIHEIAQAIVEHDGHRMDALVDRFDFSHPETLDELLEYAQGLKG